MLRRLDSDSTSRLRKRLVAAVMVPTALVSLALMANPKILTIFDIGVELDTGSPASVALLRKHQFWLWASLPGLAQIDGHQINHLYYGRKL